jgi:hypothetical protein
MLFRPSLRLAEMRLSRSLLQLGEVWTALIAFRPGDWTGVETPDLLARSRVVSNQLLYI